LLLPLITLPLSCLLPLAGLGLGLGIFMPASNAAIMGTGPAGATAILGGLVTTARGIGTTLGITLLTLTPHLAGGAGGSRAGFAVLAAAGVGAASTAHAGRPAEDDRTPAGEGPGAFS
jgi:hypothetical protein